MTKQELIETAKAMIAAPSCCQDLKTVAQAWIDAVGTAGEKAAADALLTDSLPSKENVLRSHS